MEDNTTYLVYESAMARMERIVKRMWILCILLLVLLVSSNFLWIWYASQFDTVETTTQEVQQYGGGENSFIGGDYYGGTDSQDDHNEE